MTHRLARMLLFSLLLAPAFGLADCPLPGISCPATSVLLANTPSTDTTRVVYLAGNLSNEKLVMLGAAIAAAERPGLLLLDSKKAANAQRRLLQSYRPNRVIPIGRFVNGISDLEQRLEWKVESILDWRSNLPLELCRQFQLTTDSVVVCPAQPYRQLLLAACLAGVMRAPLYVLHGEANETKELRDWISKGRSTTIFAVATAAKACQALKEVHVERLADENAVATAYRQRQLKRGPIDSLVVANPADIDHPSGVMSVLAPWITIQKRGVLLLTNDAGDNVPELVQDALRHKELQRAENLILVADLQAIPTERRPNPFPEGKDPFIEMEPLTPSNSEPYTFSTGRLFHDDPSVVTLMLARQQLLPKSGQPRKALVVSNPGGSLPMLETFSRNSAKEIRNVGYETTTLFGPEVSRDALRRLLPQQDVFLWEGHHNTLIKEWGFADWTEPLQPSLVFLQSCLALKDYKAQPLLERGALCVVGSSTRIYSASGGAFALSFFDSMLYEQRSMGASLRQAKNFLVAYSQLKEKRLGGDAKLTAANLRSAWAFSLWGDPTLKLPPPETPEDALPGVRHTVQGNVITVKMPQTAHERAITSKYKAQMLPNGRLAGLITRDLDETRPTLVPFVFAEIALPHAPARKTPQLSSRASSNRYVFCWDARRRSGYLLLIPRESDGEELKFHVHWEESE